MPSKRKLEQLKKARAASVQSFKKRKLESSLLLSNSTQLKTDDDKLNESDTIDKEAKSGTLFGDEGDSAYGEGRHSNAEEPNFPGEQLSIDGGAKSGGWPKEIKWSREAETKMRGIYGKGSRSTQKRQRKSARELESEASKTYKLGALWEGHTGQATISAPNDLEGVHLPLPLPSHLQSDTERDMNSAINRTVSKNVPPLTEDELSNTLGKAKEVKKRGLSEARTVHQHSMVGAGPGIIAGEGCGTSKHDGNELQRRYDDLASLP